jgi:hypothetical protein
MLRLMPEHLIGNLVCEAALAPFADGCWYTAYTTGDGLAYRFPAGALMAARYLTADTLLEGSDLVTFLITLQEGADRQPFKLVYGVLCQCSARIRLPLDALTLNHWRYQREGAWLKPICYGQRADLHKVDRMTITVLRKSDRPARWCLTTIVAVAEEPPRLPALLLPKGPLLDELGQSTLRTWPTKSWHPSEVTARLYAQQAVAPAQRWPATFSRWGGWTGSRVEATGFFRTHNDGQRWWLVDPDGYLFWSSGLNCVQIDTDAAYTDLTSALTWMPDSDGPYKPIYNQHDDQTQTINYLAANLIRAFGPEAWYTCWSEITLSMLRRFGFNTIGTWSDWHSAQAK